MTGKAVPVGPHGRKVADEIDRLRCAHGMSFTDLANATGHRFAPTAVRRIRDYERHLDVDDLVVISEALGTTVQDLLSEADETEHRITCLRWLLAEAEHHALTQHSDTP